jgi:hypothetical protein
MASHHVLHDVDDAGKDFTQSEAAAAAMAQHGVRPGTLLVLAEA